MCDISVASPYPALIDCTDLQNVGGGGRGVCGSGHNDITVAVAHDRHSAVGLSFVFHGFQDFVL